MNLNNENITSEMEKEIEKKTGMNAEDIKKAFDSRDLSKVMKKIDKNDFQKIEKVLSDKKSAMKLLSTPKAQALLKKFLGGK